MPLLAVVAMRPDKRNGPEVITPQPASEVIADLHETLASAADKSRMPRRWTGCPMGCPAGYHEWPCTVGRPLGELLRGVAA